MDAPSFGASVIACLFVVASLICGAHVLSVIYVADMESTHPANIYKEAQ